MNTMTLRASQTLISFEDRGTGTVVVLLHAFPFDSSMWRSQVADLASHHRVLAPDFPGFGGSAVSAGLTVDSAADIVAELLDHLGVNERVIVAGLSMGGYVALAFARLYPQRLGALILADTKADPDDDAGRAARDKSIQLVTDQGTNALVDQLLPKLLSPMTAAQKPDVVKAVREIAMRQPVEGIVAALKALRDRPDATPGLQHVAVPTLVLVGEQDGITPPDKAKVLADSIPNARLSPIADAGHLANLENDSAFNSALREFLNSLPANQTPARTV
jgi:pimeloyl-ACP methyl ester carboxylesterase